MNDALRLEHSSSTARDHFVVTWCFFNVCNYSCSYCGKFYNDGSKRGVTLDEARNFVLSLTKHQTEKKIFFEFTGGEITMFRDFPALVRFLKELGHEVAIISNGSQPLSYWKNLADDLGHIALSFHPGLSSKNHFLELIDFLSEKMTVHLNVMMMKSHFDELLEFAAMLQKKFPLLTISLQTILNTNESYGPKQFFHLTNQLLPDGEVARTSRNQSWPLFSDPHFPYRTSMELVSAAGERTVLNPEKDKENFWKGWTCYAGLENLIVDWSGDIFRSWCKAGGKIGNVRDKNFTFPESPVICPREFCRNPFDIASTKHK